jgi:hypothetical protein
MSGDGRVGCHHGRRRDVVVVERRSTLVGSQERADRRDC